VENNYVGIKGVIKLLGSSLATFRAVLNWYVLWCRWYDFISHFFL